MDGGAWKAAVHGVAEGGIRLSDFTFTFHFHQEAFEFLFTFCHKGGVIGISEVIDISPSNLDSSLCFIQPIISYDVLCILSYISRVTIYSLDELLFLFGTSLLFHVQF